MRRGDVGLFHHHVECGVCLIVDKARRRGARGSEPAIGRCREYGVRVGACRVSGALPKCGPSEEGAHLTIWLRGV